MSRGFTLLEVLVALTILGLAIVTLLQLSSQGLRLLSLERLEEMNRDGVKTVPARVRAELRGVVESMPNHVKEPLRDSGQVQDTLDSLFEVQERLFRWRYPDWEDIEPDGGGTADFDYAS